ncbi:MAG: 3'-5' exonuclease [Acidimicrobiales bacterium]|nr:3'-5' exonuclease [Acidimicrobiales bacterium]
MSLQQRIVAIDCETTGFGKHDRIVEFAAVEVDIDTGQVVDEIDTLVNPERDVGPVNVHGVTASMVSAAPTFEEVAGALGRRLQGSVLVAHNLAFDARLLGQEFQRLGTAFDPGAGYCTLRATSQKLGLACESFGIAHADQHRALSDARATAQLASLLLDDDALPSNSAEACRIGYI